MNAGERGLIGKVVVLWLFVVAVVALVAIDGARIVVTRVRSGDLASDAASAAADAFERTGSDEAARLAALRTIADADQPARLQRIDVRRHRVSLVVVARADTLVVGRVPGIDDLARLTVAGSAPIGAPGP